MFNVFRQKLRLTISQTLRSLVPSGRNVYRNAFKRAPKPCKGDMFITDKTVEIPKLAAMMPFIVILLQQRLHKFDALFRNRLRIRFEVEHLR